MPKPLVHAKPVDVGWLAGLFEGEGCLSYLKTRGVWSLSLSMTDRDVVERFAGFFEIQPCGPYRYKGSTKDIWRSSVGDRDTIYQFVNLVYNELGSRRLNKVDEFITWYEDKGDKRLCKKQLHVLTGEGRCKPCRREYNRKYWSENYA